MTTNQESIKEYGVNEFDIKSIQDKALLVRLVRKKLNNSKPDEKLTNAMHQQAKVKDKGTVRVFKSLFPKECVSEYTKHMNEASIYFYTNTTPWEDTGFRLLMVKNHSEFSQKMRGYMESFDDAVERFLQNLKSNIDKAEVALGDAFDRNDYLDVDALRQSFCLEIKFSSIPDADDVRLSLPQEELEQIQRDIREHLQEKVKRTTLDLWQRMQKQLTYMKKQMNEVKKPEKLSDTIITNIRDICDLIPHLNITQDGELEKMKDVVINRLSHFNPDDIRESEEIRDELAETSEELIDDIESKMADYIG
jgi:hypothetical protein